MPTLCVLAGSAAASELSEFFAGKYPRSLRQIAYGAVLGVGESSTLYWFFSIPLFLFMIALALLPFMNKSSQEAPLRRARAVLQSGVLFGVVVSLCIIAFRWPTLSLAECNPDESELVAGAMTLSHDPVFWRSVDGATRGPLTYYALMLPRLLGLPIDYGSAKAVALLFMIGSVLLLYAAMRKVTTEPLARLAALPPATCIALMSYHPAITYNDYLAYNGEYVTVFLLSLGLYFFIRLVVASASTMGRWAFLAGLAAGSVPFAKLQGVPSAALLAVMSLVAVFARFRSERRAVLLSVIWLAVGGLAIPLLVLALLLVFGVWRDFWQSYILNNLSYATPQTLGFGAKILGIVELVRGTPDTRNLDMKLYLGAMAQAIIVGTALLMVLGAKVSVRTRYLVYGAFYLLAAAFYSTVQPGNTFEHYLVLLLFPVAFVVGVLLAAVFEMADHVRRPLVRKVLRAILVAAFMLGLVAVPFLGDVRESKEIFEVADPGDMIDASPTARTILQFARPGESMAVWGWMSRYHVQTGLIMGTRDGASIRQIEEGPQQAYYRQRYMADLAKSRPPVFLDVIGKDAFRLDDRAKFGHETFPELADYIARHYQLVAETEGRRIYVSNERLDRLSQTP